MLLVKKCDLFLYLFLVKIRLSILFENVLDRKETFFIHKKFNLLKTKIRIFPKGLTHAAVWSKNAMFFSVCFRSK